MGDARYRCTRMDVPLMAAPEPDLPPIDPRGTGRLVYDKEARVIRKAAPEPGAPRQPHCEHHLEAATNRLAMLTARAERDAALAKLAALATPPAPASREINLVAAGLFNMLSACATCEDEDLCSACKITIVNALKQVATPPAVEGCRQCGHLSHAKAACGFRDDSRDEECGCSAAPDAAQIEASMREAFVKWCAEYCSPGADTSKWYWQIWQAAYRQGCKLALLETGRIEGVRYIEINKPPSDAPAFIEAVATLRRRRRNMTGIEIDAALDDILNTFHKVLDGHHNLPHHNHDATSGRCSNCCAPGCDCEYGASSA